MKRRIDNKPPVMGITAHEAALRSKAEIIARRSAILLKADLRRINAAATLEDARREKEIAQAICAADNAEQLRAALSNMHKFIFDIRAAAGKGAQRRAAR